jgi:tetratricopeptide (TPR) repeat protein
MKGLWENGLLIRALLLVVIITLLGLSPQSHEISRHFDQARHALGFESHQAVSENLAAIAEQNPWRTDLWEESGHHALQAGNAQAAIEYFNKADAQGALSIAGAIALGEAYKQTGDLQSAIQVWEMIIQTHEPVTGTSTQAVHLQEALAHLAETYRQLDNYTGAIEYLKTLVSIQVDSQQNAASVYELGLLLAADQPEAAPAYLLQAEELNPEIASQVQPLIRGIQRSLPQEDAAYTLLAAGRELASMNKWELAAHAFQRAVGILPDYAEAWAYLGEAHQHLEPGSPIASPNGDILALQKALELAPQSLSANTFMALYWQRQDRHDLALDYLNTAAALEPRNPAVQADLGNTLAALGDLVAAQEHYQQAIDYSPRDPTYLRAFALFCIRYNVDLRNIALPAAREAVILAPEDPESLDVMGQVLFQLEDLVNAERFYQRALENDPSYAPAHLHLGQLYIIEEKLALAREHILQVLDLSKDPFILDQAERMMEYYFGP